MDIGLGVDAEPGPPPHHVGCRLRDLGTALPSAPTRHVERERVLAELEERLRLQANLVSPYFLEVSMPAVQPVVPVIDAATDCSERRVKLDLGSLKAMNASMSRTLSASARQLTVSLRRRLQALRPRRRRRVAGRSCRRETPRLVQNARQPRRRWPCRGLAVGWVRPRTRPPQ